MDGQEFRRDVPPPVGFCSRFAFWPYDAKRELPNDFCFDSVIALLVPLSLSSFDVDVLSIMIDVLLFDVDFDYVSELCR